MFYSHQKLRQGRPIAINPSCCVVLISWWMASRKNYQSFTTKDWFYRGKSREQSREIEDRSRSPEYIYIYGYVGTGATCVRAGWITQLLIPQSSVIEKFVISPASIPRMDLLQSRRILLFAKVWVYLQKYGLFGCVSEPPTFDRRRRWSSSHLICVNTCGTTIAGSSAGLITLNPRWNVFPRWSIFSTKWYDTHFWLAFCVQRFI